MADKDNGPHQRHEHGHGHETKGHHGHHSPGAGDCRPDMVPPPQQGPLNTVAITVTAGPVGSSGQPSWSLAGSFSDPAAGSVAHDQITFNHGPWRNVMLMVLEDQSGLGLDWRSGDPIRSHAGTGCPPAKSNFPAFKRIDMFGSMLLVQNTNAAHAKIQFMLRFVDRAGATVDYDPIINNGGGGFNR